MCVAYTSVLTKVVLLFLMHQSEKKLHMQSHAGCIEGRFEVRQSYKKAGCLAESCEPGREASSGSARFLEGIGTVS